MMATTKNVETCFAIICKNEYNILMLQRITILLLSRAQLHKADLEQYCSECCSAAVLQRSVLASHLGPPPPQHTN